MSTIDPRCSLFERLGAAIEVRGALSTKLKAKSRSGSPEEIRVLNDELESLDETIAILENRIKNLGPSSPTPPRVVEERAWSLPRDFPSLASSTSVTAFIKRAEIVLDAEGIPPSLWVKMFMRGLSDKELILLETSADLKETDYTKFKTSLLTVLGPRDPIRKALLDLVYARMNEGEELRHFIARFMELVNESGTKDNDFPVAIFLRSIPGWLRRAIEASPSFGENKPFFPPLQSVVSLALDLDHPVSTKQTQPSKQPPSTQKTQPSTTQKQSPVPSRQPSHTVAALTVSDELNEVKSNEVYTLTSSDGVKPPVLAPCTLNGERVLGLVDTGAAISVIDTSLAETLQLKTCPASGVVQLAQMGRNSHAKKHQWPSQSVVVASRPAGN